uniref:Putative secreted protein n=1 Tax=Ixodes ricinus TaxID=34613 RepID=A0A6B0UY22_IXORI
MLPRAQKCLLLTCSYLVWASLRLVIKNALVYTFIYFPRLIHSTPLICIRQRAYSTESSFTAWKDHVRKKASASPCSRCHVFVRHRGRGLPLTHRDTGFAETAEMVVSSVSKAAHDDRWRQSPLPIQRGKPRGSVRAVVLTTQMLSAPRTLDFRGVIPQSDGLI